VSLGRPEDAIASIAEERNATLIVMGLGGAAGLLVPRPGSIAYRVMCVANAPVVVVPREPLAA
jgi:nucleotide-binding universal stress UspA family protein